MGPHFDEIIIATLKITASLIIVAGVMTANIEASFPGIATTLSIF